MTKNHITARKICKLEFILSDCIFHKFGTFGGLLHRLYYTSSVMFDVNEYIRKEYRS
jgi:hypothetical protein